ncbi:hypothetical protein MSAN_01690300 [Mycena sanguinolenta]|uniref:Uncharacterized protein n=1 Tax=Mycena sanguinolenta TaxID=230812 RepID=A0A8H6Y0P0_9AGAR|nr:hypothetical protein MSAN_01690300 [Mycena sanguinolenta]
MNAFSLHVSCPPSRPLSPVAPDLALSQNQCHKLTAPSTFFCSAQAPWAGAAVSSSSASPSSAIPSKEGAGSKMKQNELEKRGRRPGKIYAKGDAEEQEERRRAPEAFAMRGAGACFGFVLVPPRLAFSGSPHGMEADAHAQRNIFGLGRRSCNPQRIVAPVLVCECGGWDTPPSGAAPHAPTLPAARSAPAGGWPSSSASWEPFRRGHKVSFASLRRYWVFSGCASFLFFPPSLPPRLPLLPFVSSVRAPFSPPALSTIVAHALPSARHALSFPPFLPSPRLQRVLITPPHDRPSMRR